MRAAALIFVVAMMPQVLLACRIAPWKTTEFSRESYTGIIGCSTRTCGIIEAWYTLPTERYAHAVLGDAIEGGGLGVTTTLGSDSCGARYVTLDQSHVFEDVAPRLADLDNDGDMEVITVRSHHDFGAQIAIWDDALQDSEITFQPLRLVASTPYIGTRFRWLAPLGAADLDGDGAVEIAYVDRPHLSKTLRIWRYADETLNEVAFLPGLTNHRIGEPDIAGGIRDCGAGPEMILATANWAQLVAVHWEGAEFATEVLGTDTTRPAFAAAMACR